MSVLLEDRAENSHCLDYVPRPDPHGEPKPRYEKQGHRPDPTVERGEVEILNEWQRQWQDYADDGMLSIAGDRVTLTRNGLLQVDALLPAFFEREHRGVRYT